MLFAGTGVSREAFKLLLIPSPAGLLLAEPLAALWSLPLKGAEQLADEVAKIPV